MVDDVQYSCNGVNMSVKHIEGYAEGASLWIGYENQYSIKVASFDSENKAKLFCKLCGILFGMGIFGRPNYELSDFPDESI